MKALKSCLTGAAMNNFQKQLKLQLWACFSYVQGGKHAVFLHFVQTV